MPFRKILAPDYAAPKWNGELRTLNCYAYSQKLDRSPQKSQTPLGDGDGGGRMVVCTVSRDEPRRVYYILIRRANSDDARGALQAVRENPGSPLSAGTMKHPHTMVVPTTFVLAADFIFLESPSLTIRFHFLPHDCQKRRRIWM